MVSLWYPATPGRAAGLVHDASGVRAFPGDRASQACRPRAEHGPDQAVSDAPPAGRQRSLPLVVLSPGFIQPRSVLTALAEDLASHSYVVAGIDHTYESVATAFPDGRVTTCLAREAPRRGQGQKR